MSPLRSRRGRRDVHIARRPPARRTLRGGWRDAAADGGSRPRPAGHRAASRRGLRVARSRLELPLFPLPRLLGLSRATTRSPHLAADTDAAVAWLRGQPCVDGDRIALIGASTGSHPRLDLRPPMIRGSPPSSVSARSSIRRPSVSPRSWPRRSRTCYRRDRCRSRASMAGPAAVVGWRSSRSGRVRCCSSRPGTTRSSRWPTTRAGIAVYSARVAASNAPEATTASAAAVPLARRDGLRLAGGDGGHMSRSP